MKFVISLIFIVGVCLAIYFFHTHFKGGIKNPKKLKLRALAISAFVGIVLLVFLGFAMYKSATQPDNWCNTVQNTNSFPPPELKNSMDYFEKGNYDFDTGNCKQAVLDYSQSIKLNSKYPETFNNLAYTFMRMRDYKDALTNLNNAILLNPDYVNALINRGDIYNYYLKDNEKAIMDYKKVISLVGYKGTSVCGHLFLAEHNGWNLGTLFSLPSLVFSCK